MLLIISVDLKAFIVPISYGTSVNQNIFDLFFWTIENCPGYDHHDMLALYKIKKE